MDEYGIRTPLPSDEWRKQSKKKDTRRWCKGHEGREHKPVIEMSKWPYQRGAGCHAHVEGDRFWWPMDKHGYTCYHQVNCEVCGKRLQDTPERCPDNRLQ